MTASTTGREPRGEFDPGNVLASAPPEQAELQLSDAAYDQPPHAGPVRPYVIATTQRTGSTLLCHLLTATGAMGVPTEYFKGTGIVPPVAKRLDALAADGSLRIGHYVQELQRRRTTPNGVFGAKLHFHQLETHLSNLPFCDLVREARYVWLRRRDAIAQAISFAIARQTQRFHEAEGSPRPSDDPPFDARGLLAALRGIAMQDMGWRVYFEGNAIVPLEIWYEDLVADPAWTGRRICDWMGVAPDRPLSMDAVPTRRQRSAVYDRWRATLLDQLRLLEPTTAP